MFVIIFGFEARNKRYKLLVGGAKRLKCAPIRRLGQEWGDTP
jgi:hypothetical protein